MSNRVTKKDLRKVILENEENNNMTYSVAANDQNAVNKAKEASKTDGVNSTIELTTENMSDNDPIKKAFIKGLVSGNSSIEGTFVEIDGQLKNSEIANSLFNEYRESISEGENDLPEIPDEERMERGELYGEDFDKLMEELKDSKAPKIKLGENINPRMKKNDFINYLKNKK
tara:strand:- start:11248 stop:11763 length:516 start_codon:yes stop_codon:yes gene_type:complete